MKKILLLLAACAPAYVWAQCNLTNATDCDCLDGSSDCDLLPDITGSYDLLADPGSVIESPGLIELSVGTPDIGHGPLRVLPTDNYVCGTDTIYSPGGLDLCPDGTLPHQIIKQRIYHKSGSTMTYWERNAGTMTYHPTHGHFHTDNWGIYTLRKPIDGVDDPLAWPIIGYGTKMGFCLMDLANCASPGNYGYCREADGTVLTSDAPNYGLGGGGYNCAITDQGISCGFMDIYDYYLDGMNIVLDPGVCNGDYKIVVQIDPNNNYLEENDDNNLIVMDYTLSEQPEDVNFAPMTVTGELTICEGSSVTLSASPVGTTYLWSDGETTQTITVSTPGTYYCTATRDCGPFFTDTVVVNSIPVTEPTADVVDAVCIGTPATLTAAGDGTINWYDAPLGGTLLGTGSSYTTEPLAENTTFYAENEKASITDVSGHTGMIDHSGSDYSSDTYNEYEIFNALNDFTLNSVKVYTDFEGEREIELRDASDAVLQSVTVNIPEGTTVVDLNFDIPVGTGYHLATNTAVNNDNFGTNSPQLKRSNTGVVFPYTLDDVVSITNSSQGTSYYYYFYDWDITSSKTFTCTSTRIPVEATVKVCTAIGDVSSVNTLDIFPNPSDGQFEVKADMFATEQLSVKVMNITGQTVFEKTMSNVSGQIDIPVNLSASAKGVYMVELTADGNTVSRRIVFE